MTLLLIVVVWWPLLEDYVATVDPSRPIWSQLDWLLLGLFAAMSGLIMVGADLRMDSILILVGGAGGFIIESWGTQTGLWAYYTLERPPLWIIPAWPIATLSIDRLVRILERILPARLHARLGSIYWWLLLPFCGLMFSFIRPTFDQPMTLAAGTLCALIIASPNDKRLAAMYVLAGALLGYFLEVWGTSRGCWTYYTLETPPIFAVLAHGMAAFAFWRFSKVARGFLSRVSLWAEGPVAVLDRLIGRAQ